MIFKNSETKQEHLRIHVPNLECYCFGFMRDGKSIYSGWHDGKIRSFLPQSGKLLYCINEAHTNGVTAITATSDCNKIVSGGMNGEIRVWRISTHAQKMEASLKEHRSRVWNIIINSKNDRAISASADGSCIEWETGTNKKITYWDLIDCAEIRSIDGSLDGEINTLAICKSGEFFISAGEDKEIKIWEYDTAIPMWRGIGHSNGINRIAISPNQEFAIPMWRGIGHSNGINRIAISPNQEFIVSVGQDGSIFIFETPMEIRLAKKDYNKPQ